MRQSEASHGARSVRWTRWIVIAAVVLLTTTLCSISTSRDGLYNNISDPDRAMAVHNEAWLKTGWGQEFSRLDMAMYVRGFEGNCITNEVEWETVPMDRRIDERLIRNRIPIACYFSISGRRPFDFPENHRWTTVLIAKSENELRLVGHSRRTFGMDF